MELIIPGIIGMIIIYACAWWYANHKNHNK